MHESLTPAATTPRQMPRLCVMIPCYNEEESIPLLAEQLPQVLDAAMEGSWSVLFIDDGSIDGTSRLVWDLSHADRRFAGIRLSRNFGHQAALAAGLRFARGECIGVIDCDLQDPLEVLVELYQKVTSEGYDVCAGQRGEREDVSWWLQLAYNGFYRLMAAVAEHKFTVDSGDFCVFNRRVHLALLSLPETMQVLRGLRSWVGFRQTVLNYRRPPRSRGHKQIQSPPARAIGDHQRRQFFHLPTKGGNLPRAGYVCTDRRRHHLFPDQSICPFLYSLRLPNQ
ncbi:MAG: glycosyltransferase family 2 protein [Verrucomicrobiales bacterium]